MDDWADVLAFAVIAGISYALARKMLTPSTAKLQYVSGTVPAGMVWDETHASYVMRDLLGVVTESFRMP